MNDKLQAVLSDGQIEQIKNTSPLYRKDMGFTCNFTTRRAQFWGDYAAPVALSGMFKSGIVIYTFDEFVKRVDCIDQRGNSVDVANLGLFNN